VGKTSVILHLAALLAKEGVRPAVVKFDALSSADDVIFREKLGIPALVGLSDYVCPDHYYVSNIEEACVWGREAGADLLVLETAGLCHRCAPHIKGVPALTVLDSLGGVDAPRKMGPAASLADIIVVTKCDLVSQAEREVFDFAVASVNPTAAIVHVNGLTGTGALHLQRMARTWPRVDGVEDAVLRYSMPASICSYCTGERRIGRRYQSGNVEKLVVAKEAA
jgi:Ni2+-binding GTPase involved in maturation of urease and hydrogenase